MLAHETVIIDKIALTTGTVLRQHLNVDQPGNERGTEMVKSRSGR
jgi:hypothetical protein